MKFLGLVLILLTMLVSVTVAQYHDPTYLMGGYGTTTSYYWNGIWVGDAANKTLKHLTPNNRFYTSYTITMDLDNRKVLVGAYGTTSTSYASYKQNGIYRIDPNTLAITTVMMDTQNVYGPRRLMINQDGDYVFACYQRINNVYQYSFLKLDSTGTMLTTIMNSTQMQGATAVGVGRNMDTGLYLFNPYRSNTFYYSVIECDDNGVYTTFGGGTVSSQYGWYGYYANMEQDFDTGHIVGHYYRNLYELKRGAMNRTTLWQLGLPGGYTMRYGSRFDLQSAANKRIVASGYFQTMRNGLTHNLPTVFYIDAKPPYSVTATQVDPANTTGLRYHYSYGFDFYRGRHLQTFKQAPGKWDLLISCPNFPNRQYRVALSMTGYRPAIPLPDGRRLYLRPDILTQLSLSNLLNPFFNPGPLQLNARGEAIARFDVSTLPKLNGQPIWIAVAVLDPKAPYGLAYLPDTQVLRLP